MSNLIFAASGLSKSFKSSPGIFKSSIQVQALDNISFTLNRGETIAIVGETGSGKTTLAHVLSGLETADSGIMLLHGKTIDYRKQKQHSLHQQIRLIFQNPGRTLNPRTTIAQTLLQPLQSCNKFPPHQHQAMLIEILQKVGLRADQAHWYPHMFSVGQQQRIAIARALISEPEIVVADEPLSSLDVSVQAQIVNLLLDLQKQIGVSYIFISHNLNVVKHISDKVLVMFGGHLVEYGPSNDVFSKPVHPYTRSLLASTPGFRNNVPISWRANEKVYTQSQGLIQGCAFAHRCREASDECLNTQPLQLPIGNQLVACLKAKQI
jgi:dipeptide transport system ATP-binding protein